MAKSASQLFKEKIDPSQIGNPQLRQQLERLYAQNYKDQLAEVNANFQAGLDMGLTQAEAATTWVSGGSSQYVIKEGDNLSTIAKNTGSTPDAILTANPDMKTPQTGMVVNAPASTPTQPQYLGQGLSIGGTPSNAALGSTTTNPQGVNRYAAANPAQLQAYGAAIGNAPNNTQVNLGNQGRNVMGGAVNSANPFLPTAPGAGRNVTGGWNPEGTGGNAPYTPAAQSPYTPGTAPVTATISTQQESRQAQNIRQRTTQRGLVQIMDRINSPDYTPTERELNVLLHYKLINPASPQANGGLGGNYSYGSMRRRGGSGGGGGNSGGRNYANSQNEPAFSSGGGMRGLINWRI